MPRVLYVCLGNICRSPLAEAAFRAAAEAAGLAAEADSAGTGDWHVGRRPTRARRRWHWPTAATSRKCGRDR